MKTHALGTDIDMNETPIIHVSDFDPDAPIHLAFSSYGMTFCNEVHAGRIYFDSLVDAPGDSLCKKCVEVAERNFYDPIWV